MLRSIFPAAVFAILASTLASAQPMSLAPPGYARPATPPLLVATQPQRMQAGLGGGFLEFLFGDGARQAAVPAPVYYPPGPRQPLIHGNPGMAARASLQSQPSEYDMDPRFERQEVEYQTKEAPGTIVIDSPNHFLYLVEAGGRAMRYGIGVGRPGFSWSGTHTVSAKKEWPDWVPPAEMLQRQPNLPRFLAGGPDNPLGARAMYLGSTLYRIHGSNEPWTIGHNVSSGCIRLRNADVIDLYERVKVGTKVIVL